MSQHNFTAIVNQYPQVIAQMPAVFSAHEFILKLAEQNQGLYIEALHTYRMSPAPFQTVHQQLAAKLNDFSHLVQRIGNEPHSQDIWTNSQSCSRWERLPMRVPANVPSPTLQVV